MRIDLRELTDTSVRFVVEETEPSFVNALRRTILADIPKMAIEEVEFHLGPIRGEEGKEYESVAPLFDEIIAHRVGLIPIPTDLKLFVPRSQCKACNGEGCPSCTIIYAINKKGPCTVTSGDVEPIGDPRFRPTDPNIPITKLGEGQALLVYATAILGTGREHAKWQVAHGVAYKYYPIVEISQKKRDWDPPIAKSCPVNILSIQDGKMIVTDVEACTLCKLCEEASEGAIKVSSDPSKFIFGFETDGSLTAKEVLLKALEILEERFAGLAIAASQIVATEL